MANLRDKLKTLPSNSGVYLMRDDNAKILYIGKARNLKNRVSQYFSSYGTSTEKITALMSKVCDFNYIITNNEIDALVLENNLIKKHKPQYNIMLKDDKSYPFIRIDLKTKYPIIEVVRKVHNDGARYFGPYMQSISIKDITELIYSSFTIRNCKHSLSNLPATHRPCLNYHINRCLAPCIGEINEQDYHNIIEEVIEFLNGNDKHIQAILNSKMENASHSEEFELAIYYRDKLNILDKIVRKQVAYLPKDYNLDIFGVADNGFRSVVSVMIVRGGKMVGSQNVLLENASLDESTTLTQFLSQYYDLEPLLADEVVVSVKLLEKSALQALWASKYNRIVKITMPIKGIRRQFADMADKNASDYLINSSEEIAKREMMTAGATKQLQDILEIGHDLDRIEAYDISNISGSNKVASMVVFMRGVPSTKNYRRFKIRTVKGSDDYACLAEALDRRFKRLKASEEKSFMVEPSLIIIDGGLGQLNISLAIMQKNNYNIPMIGIAKREETIVLEGGREILLPRNSLALHLIQRIRDEAHRFAVTYHRSLRAKDSILSELLSIEGVGSHTEKLLFEHFKTIDKIRNARIEEIMSIPRMSTRIAENIYKYFNLEDNAE